MHCSSQVTEWINVHSNFRRLLFEGTMTSLRECSTEATTDDRKEVQEEKEKKASEVISAAKTLKKLCEDPEQKKEFMEAVSRTCPELVKNIPDFAHALDALPYIPFDRLRNPKDVLTFVNALIESGMATQVDRGLIFTLGNTGDQRCLFIFR